jgi:hypothetical protein
MTPPAVLTALQSFCDLDPHYNKSKQQQDSDNLDALADEESESESESDDESNDDTNSNDYNA